MGRAAGKVADQFSSVFGALRGPSAEHEAQLEEAHGEAPFGRGGDGEQKMELVEWLIVEHATTRAIGAAEVVRNSGMYKRYHPHREEACNADFEDLVAQGICYLVDSTEETYILKSPSDWSLGHQLAYDLWATPKWS